MNSNYCLFYVVGILAASAYDDISYNKVATQSNTHPGTNFDASNAVDRNTTTCTRTYEIGQNSPAKTVWWKVDLGGVYNIHSIHMLFKNYNLQEDRQKGRFAGFSLYVSNTGVIQGSTLCYKDGPHLPPLNLTIDCAEPGRYVIFYNERLNGVTYPTGYVLNSVYTELCEVIVRGCNNAGFYGSKCDIPCPTNCKEGTCHIQSGACFTCNPGWTDKLCNKSCTGGWYGINCSQQCVGHCRDGTTCNYLTGLCDRGCEAGWRGTRCDTECDDGTYGYNCTSSCSGHCLNKSPCNKKTGHCDKGCNPGYTRSYCSKECSPGHYGLDCKDNCSGHCINNEPCDHVIGVCPSGCQDGYTGARCTKTCVEGYYGGNCSKVCFLNCKTCRHTDGQCSCVAGWMGSNCSIECDQSYGENCRYACGEHCVNQTCDRFNGSCLLGRTDGQSFHKYSEKIRLLTEELIESSKQMLLWIIGFSVALAVCVLFIIITCTITILRKTACNVKRKTEDKQPCLRSTTTAKHPVTTNVVSNYQELNTEKERNAYESILLQ